jgi:hypothetical protein
MRLMTCSGVNIGGISLPWRGCAGFSSQAPVLNLYRSRASSRAGVIPEIDIWRAAHLMLKRYARRPRLKAPDGPTSSRAARDHCLLLSFIYTSCTTTCPLLTQRMALLEDLLKNSELWPSSGTR